MHMPILASFQAMPEPAHPFRITPQMLWLYTERHEDPGPHWRCRALGGLRAPILTGRELTDILNAPTISETPATRGGRKRSRSPPGEERQ